MTDAQNTEYNFKGRVAIVTGAGSGIGRAMALGFATGGAAVLVNDVIAERAHETVELIKQGGGDALAAVGDISDEASVESFVSAAVDHWGQIDILCNNAGIMDKIHLPAETPTPIWNRTMAVNATGTFFVTRAVLPHMLARKSGSIINTASAAGIRGGAAGFAYVASKHAVVGMTRHVAWVHGPDGIRCNAICPGAVETNITGGGGFEAFDPEGIKRVMPIMMLGRLGQPPQIASLALFLGSDASAFINGAVIAADGGWSAG